MPDSEVEDRAQSFFAQENLSQGQHSHALGGNWPSDNGLRVSNQKRIGTLGPSTKSGPQQSDIELRHNSQQFSVPNGFNFTQTTGRPDSAKYNSQIQHQNLNGYMYGHHILQTRSDETNIWGFNTKVDQANMNQRGFLVTEQVPSSHKSNEFDGLNAFGGQHPGLLQSVQQQQSGFNDIQHLQQQLMLKKMQELQRQKNMQQHDLVNHSHGVINPVHMGFAHQQVDQSLYGVPVSSSTGPLNPYPVISTYCNSFPVNQFHTSGQGSDNWTNMEQIQQMKPAHQTGSDQVFGRPQDLMSPSEMAQDEPEMASLDPEEEKILFGTDENIWDAFGSDGVSNLLDDNEFASGLPSIQSGSWSALMQSAVAETTSSDIGMQEELTGLTSQNLQHPSGRHSSNNQIDMWRVNNAHSNSVVDMGLTSTSIGSPQINEGYTVNTPEVSNMHGGSQFGQLPSNSHQLSYWKHVESSVKSQHHLNQVSESSFNSSDKEDIKMHEIESRSKRENSNDSYQSTLSRQLISDAGDMRGPSGRLTSGQHKFWYHPMGNVDEDIVTPYGKRQVTTTHAMSLQNFQGLRGQNQENFGHIKISGQDPKVDQNMLEVLQKADQSRRHLNSSGHNLSSEMHDPDCSDGSVGGLQRSQSSNSQGFGLHLGTPSQRLPVPDNASKSLNWAHISSNLRDKGQFVLPSSPHFQETAPVGTLGAVFPISKRQLQNHQMIASRSQLNIVESTSVAQETENRGNLLPDIGTSSFSSQVLDSAGEQSTQGSFPQNVLSVKVDQGQTTSQTDLEAFGCSLKPTKFHQNSSIMNQRNRDHDSGNRVTKRLKLSDSLLSDQNESQTSVPSNIITSIKAEHSHVSPQMAPSWFARYGTFKNDQFPETVVKVKSTDQLFNDERLSGGLKTHGEVSHAAVSKTFVPSLMALGQGPTLLPTDGGVQNLITLRPKKHMLTTVDLHPWQLEVSGSFKNLKGICTGAVEWSRAANRLMEKVDDDGDIIEDKPPIARPRKRLIFTSLLMQQLFRPPPPAILSLDVSSNCESGVYYVARLALGDACNLVSSATNPSSISLGGTNSLSNKSEQSEGNVDDRLPKLIEGFMSKARKLEDDFLRLDKRTSILDLRLEFQDLERFSAINRFARFHGRGQSDVSETLKPLPQRYVTAFQLPANLPDRVQCLSL